MKEFIGQLGIKKCLILAGAIICLILLSLPKGEQKTKQEATESKETSKEDSVEQLEQRLKDTLSNVEGVGSVKVMITLKSSKESVVNKDTPYTEEQETSGDDQKKSVSRQEETVLVDGENGSEPYVVKELEPEVEGVVVIAEGGSDAMVQENITEAVTALFGVPAHKVKVLKMGEHS